MLGLGTVHMYYYHHLSAVDMRKGFNGSVSEHMEQEQGQNIVYAFINKSKDKLKLLHWRAGGFVLYNKRLEKGIFELPKYDIEDGLAVLTCAEMIMILDGISIVNAKKNTRYLSSK